MVTMSIITNVTRAERIRELRLRAGLSRERLARLANCSFSSIAAIERGYIPERSVIVPEIERVLDALTDNEQRPGERNPTAAKADDPGRQNRA
jgi:transcriptional regulator with XRE-family HTH domain